MTYFTIITGIATLISLFLQVSGMFPNQKRYISHATVFLIGLTLGLLFGLGSSVNLNISQTLTAKELLGVFLFGGTGLLIFILVVASIFIEDEARRRTATNAASAVSTFLVIALFFLLTTFFR